VLYFTVVREGKVTLLLGVAVRSSAYQITSNLPFEFIRSSVGNIAIGQNRKEHQLRRRFHIILQRTLLKLKNNSCV